MLDRQWLQIVKGAIVARTVAKIELTTFVLQTQHVHLTSEFVESPSLKSIIRYLHRPAAVIADFGLADVVTTADRAGASFYCTTLAWTNLGVHGKYCQNAC